MCMETLKLHNGRWIAISEALVETNPHYIVYALHLFPLSRRYVIIVLYRFRYVIHDLDILHKTHVFI